MLIYIYFGYALLLHLLALVFPFRHKVDESYCPEITLLFAARNEINTLPQKINSLNELDYPKDKLQILIASDASEDGSDEYLSSIEEIELVSLPDHSGKNAALNALLPKARGEILFFTDANTLLHPQALRKVARHFVDERVGAVTGDLVFTLDGEWNPVGQGTGLYWRYENSIKRAENRLGTVLVGCGPLFAVRRQLVQPLDPRVANDLEIPTRVGAQGLAVLYDPECMGYEKAHTDAGEEVARTSRIVARGVRGFVVLFSKLIRSPLRLWEFISHKALRWFTLPLCLLLFVCGGLLIESTIAAIVFGMGCLLLGGALIGLLFLRMPNQPKWARPLTLLSHMLLMYTGATWGIIKAITGHTPATWSIPKSTRE